MVDPAITMFFTENDISKEDWLPKAAKMAQSRAYSTHPSKFSHPDTGVGKKNKKILTYVTPIRCRAPQGNDGFLRSGNVKTEEATETLGDAAALKVDSFLKLTMSDGATILKHIEMETELAKNLLSIQSEPYESLREGFLSIMEPGIGISTSSKIKQVYFPVDASYHQLSILSNSGLIFELKKRIDSTRYSDEVKELRDLKRKGEFSEQGFSELYGITTIGYGGSKPQNISALNKQNYGKAHLLLSAPPVLSKRSVHFPKQNFFGESFRYYECREVFDALHKLFQIDYNNKNIREGRDYRLQDLVDRIIDRMWAVRLVSAEQYRPELSHLKQHQKIWLCDEFQQTREEESEWLDKLCTETASWIIRSYEKLMGKRAYKLGEAERVHIHELVSDNQEGLR